MTVLVFLDPDYPDGRIADASQPQLKVTDTGVTRGDGIFETMLAVSGTPRKLRAHLARLATSAEAMELDVPASDVWERAISTALTVTDDDGDLVVKLVATRGEEGAGATAWVLVSPVPGGLRGRRLAVLLLDRGYDSTVGQRAPWLLMGAKTLSYAVNMAALRHARSHGADDVIFTSSDGKVLEGPTSTVLIARVRDGVKHLITPQLESGILPGTSQGALFTAARSAGWELGYGPLVPADLFASDGVWLISSVRLLAEVESIDGKPVTVSPELTAELGALVDSVS
ncbi:4-amino-4-deoxychorismate lyase [Arthrobacter subterraneus]|uniref:4-amino-4-deoxychorismate lyase n=1 Tax=Arthrobacter subterraneus TaxID=335973 RepID=A0A1G8DDB8_9MICC|nr:aminodeoxychorismate lyase [Arthrobacter subterraneus]SDH55665.1 4-amino-4-deoxychorismate lyase [Arthrobacter subterraneus]